MRLTLRTLLGYLDDILEPQQTKELGEKISESGVAAALVARIREVVRRRRILAPEVSGPGSDPDPNLVSEYLDNTLSADRIEDFERLCLESDVHLAEVAGCHQILTMVLGEPVEVAAGTRERMYALGTVATPAANGRPQQAAAAAPPPVAATLPAPAPREIPEYLSSGTQWRRLLPGAAAMLVVGLWLALIFSDPTQSWRFWEQRATPASPTPALATATPADAAASNVPAPVAAGPAAPAAGEVAAAMTVDQPVAAAVSPDSVPIPGEAAAALIAASTPLPQAGLPGVTPLPATPEPAATPTPVQPASPAPTAVAVNSKLLYNGVAGVLLRRNERGEWEMLPRRTLLHPGDELASPEPFESPLQILDSDHEIILAGGARLTVLPGSADAETALAIDRGKLIFRRSAAAPLPDVRPIALQLGDAAYRMELLTAGTECGLELIREPSMGGPEVNVMPGCDGELYLTAGSVRLTPVAGGPPLLLEGTSGFLALADGRPASSVQPLLAVPAWMTAPTGGAAVVAQQTMRQFEGSFQLNAPVEATIPALVNDRQPRIAELGAKVLALTDDYRGMVRALTAPHQEARLAGFNGLGIWIRRGPINPQLLTDELSRVFPDAETARRLLRLVWGYQPQDAARPDVSVELVEWLRDGNVGVREGAFLQIKRLTGGTVTYRYHPDGTEMQRASAVRQWENHVRKTGALLEPAAAAPLGGATPTPPVVEPTPAAAPPTVP